MFFVNDNMTTIKKNNLQFCHFISVFTALKMYSLAISNICTNTWFLKKSSILIKSYTA
uniref:Uncharacterized protein n=1 Tax=Anguilla anguilla TaxID=7936 RepID=A0A0E9XEH3_ANGAN